MGLFNLLLGRSNKDKNNTHKAEDYFNLGIQYELGKNVEQDIGKAAIFYRKACENGYADGCTNLGILYRSGRGVVQNTPKAIEYYQKGCENGSSMACCNLGVLYSIGDGVEQNFKKAIKLYEKACNSGNPEGCFYIGVMYFKGEGVNQNDALAKKFFTKACDSGHIRGCDSLKELTKINAQEQKYIDEANQRINSIKEQIDPNSQRFIHAVKKIEKSKWGIFLDIQNDLGEYIYGLENDLFIDNNDNEVNEVHKMNYMAYGYARKASAAGLYLQGILDNKEYSHINDVFQSIQYNTEHTKEFQIEAFKRSAALLHSYDARLTEKFIQIIITAVNNKTVACAKDLDKYYTVDNIFGMIKS